MQSRNSKKRTFNIWYDCWLSFCPFIEINQCVLLCVLKVIEKHNEIQRLKAQLRKSEQKVNDLIQQNIKLNHEMRAMEKDHQQEVKDLKKELAKFDIFEQ